jgi:hypothetical protein
LKIKLDENLPESLIQALSTLGHDVDSVRGEAWLVTDFGPLTLRLFAGKSQFLMPNF